MTSAFLPDVISLEEVDANFSSLWVELLKSSTQSSFFHQLHYLKAIRDAFDRPIRLWFHYKGHYLESGGILFPSGFSSGILAYYLPYQDPLFCSYGNELQANRFIRYMNGYKDFIRLVERSTWFAEFEFSPESYDITEFLYQKRWHAIPRYTFYIEISEPDQILQKIHRDERRQIRNFKIPYTVTQTWESEEFIQLIIASYKRHNTMPPLSVSQMMKWLTSIRYLQGVHFMGLRNQENELVAGLVYVLFKDRAYFLLGGARSVKGPSYTPTLYYLLYKDLYERGIRTVDLLGGMHREIARFKIHIGGEPRVHFRLRYQGNRIFYPAYSVMNFWKKLKR